MIFPHTPCIKFTKTYFTWSMKGTFRPFAVRSDCQSISTWAIQIMGLFLNWLQYCALTPQSHRCWTALQLSGTSTLFADSGVYTERQLQGRRYTGLWHCLCSLLLPHYVKNKDFFTPSSMATLGVTNLKDTPFCRCFCYYYHDLLNRVSQSLKNNSSQLLQKAIFFVTQVWEVLI